LICGNIIGIQERKHEQLKGEKPMNNKTIREIVEKQGYILSTSLVGVSEREVRRP
jgi:uncharacterized protein YneF (UPF0154 family)